MKKISFRKFFSLLLAVVLVCSVLISSACSCSGDSNPTDADVPNKPVLTDKFVLPENHGECEYTILIPSGTLDANMEIAVSELQFGIKACSGYSMQTTTEYVEGKKYLSVGKTPLYDAVKDDIGAMKRNDVRVYSSDDSIVMIGGNSEYTCYAVYAFMEESFGMKWYTPYDYDVETSNTISLYEFDYSDSPDIAKRMLHQWDYWADSADLNTPSKVRCRRMKIQSMDYDDYITTGHSLNSQIMKHSIYYDEHPEWYTVAKEDVAGIESGQICLTNPELLEAFIERCKELIRANPDKDYMQLGIDDNWSYCTGAQYAKLGLPSCSCVEDAKKYNGTGSDAARAGLHIVFINKVEKVINAWVKEEFNDPNKTIQFSMFAYFHTLMPPVKDVKVDGKTTYVPVCDEVIPNENLSVMYAPLNNDFTYSFDQEKSGTVHRMINQWLALTPNIIMYSYGTPYGVSGYLPINDLTTMQGSYSYAIEKGFSGYLEEASTYGYNPSFARLKDYVRSEIWWDGSRSVDEIAFEFIDYYYGPVAYEVKEYYKALKQFQIYQIEELGLKVYIMSSTYGIKDYWPKDAFDSFNNIIDNIIEKLEPLKKENPDKYQMYFDRINVEKIWVYYGYLQNYNDYFSTSSRIEMIDFMEKYCMRYSVGIKSYANLVASWRASI